jgi:hypothetical protein
MATAKRVLKKGGADEQLIKLLKAHAGELTVEELAAEYVRRGGRKGTKPESLRSQISKVRGLLLNEYNVAEDKVNAIMPKGFGESGAGRREKPAMDESDIAALL